MYTQVVESGKFKVGDHVKIRYTTFQYRPFYKVVELNCYVSRVYASPITGEPQYEFSHEWNDSSMGHGPVDIYSLIESMEKI